VNEFSHAPGVAYTVPIDANLRWADLVARVQSAADSRAESEQVGQEIRQAVSAYAEAGLKCMRAPSAPFDRLEAAAYEKDYLDKAEPTAKDVAAFLGHTLFQALAKHDMVAQLFLGVEPTSSGVSAAVNDSRRVPNLHRLFAMHTCRFELVVGAELGNLDVVQAARIFPNVYVGGMWWYNFRASTYRQSMQYRLEALPASKCSLIASDARCIEWCYGKILLVKRLMADFLHDQIALGWLDYDEALRVARYWLHDTAASLYT
jgi:glucuronate isomerase